MRTHAPLPTLILAALTLGLASPAHASGRSHSDYATYILHGGAYVAIDIQTDLDYWANRLFGGTGCLTIYVNRHQYSDYGPDYCTYMSVPYVDGYVHGNVDRYHLDASHHIALRTPYHRGQIHGTVHRYNRYGRLSRSCDYDYGRRHGVEVEYGYRDNGHGVYVRYESSRQHYNYGECYTPGNSRTYTFSYSNSRPRSYGMGNGSYSHNYNYGHNNRYYNTRSYNHRGYTRYGYNNRSYGHGHSYRYSNRSYGYRNRGYSYRNRGGYCY